MASNPNPKDKSWTRHVPFTRSWHDRRIARKQDVDSSNAAAGNVNVANDASQAGGAADFSAVKQQQIEAPVLTPSAKDSLNQSVGELDESGGARELPQNGSSPVLPSQSTSPGPPLQQTTPAPTPATAPQNRTALAPQARAVTASAKPLAQYGHHDNKGAVGWVAPTSSPHRPYPYRQHVNGQRVLAQYGHNTDKWAVKHPVY